MRLGKKSVPDTGATFGEPRVLRQCGALLLALWLAGCGWFGGEKAAPSVPSNLLGGAAGDEPRAVLVARDVLMQGGDAADAAVALALTMTATLPSRVSLGGGGACVARAGRPREPNTIAIGPINRPAPIPTDAFTFMPVPAPGGKVGMPGLLRGLATLHARYGRMRWEQLVAPAESIARFGAPMSRALALDLQEAGITLNGPDGRPLKEGDNFASPDLAVTLAAVRTRGAGDLYSGTFSKLYVDGLHGALDEASLRSYTPTVGRATGTDLGDHVAFFTPTSGGDGAAALLKVAEGDRRLRRSDPAQRSAAIVEAAAKTLPVRPQDAEDTGTTGFVVVDQRGGAVACSLTMGRLFGTRQAADTIGVVPAVPVPPGSPAALSTAAALVTNENVVQFVGGAGAGGDVSSPEGLVEVLVHTIIGEQPIQQASTYYNRAMGPGVAPPSSGAVKRDVTEASAAARVNAVICTGGLPNGPDTCAAQADPRGAGLGTLISVPRGK